MEPILVIGGIIAIIATIAITATIVSRRAQRRRKEQLAQLAAEMGFSFEPDGSALMTTGFSGLPLFNRGHSKKTKNVMRKLVQGTEITLLDHQYTVGSGNHQQTFRHTVAVFHTPDRAAFPDFEMKPETFWHKVGSLFGYQDIDFASHPTLSKRYIVRGTDEDAIRSEFAAPVLEFFEKHPDKWWVEARSNWLAIYNSGRVEPPAIRQFLTDATKVFLLFAPKSTLSDAT